MRRVSFAVFVLIISIFQSASAQTLKKYLIGASGCSVSMLCNPGEFEVNKSPDSSTVYTAECTAANLEYGVICVKLSEGVTDLDASEMVLTEYLDYLKQSFDIINAKGYTKGLKLKDNDNTRGISDLWKDKDNNNWKLKAWTDGKFIGVLYAYSKAEITDTKVDSFLDSFIFPAVATSK